MQNVIYLKTLTNEHVIMEQELSIEKYDHCDDWLTTSCQYVRDRYLSVNKRPRKATIPNYANDKAYTTF